MEPSAHALGGANRRGVELTPKGSVKDLFDLAEQTLAACLLVTQPGEVAQ
jgi:hypothetical protein